MKIILKDIGRHFNRNWIFRGVNFVFEPNNYHAILGPNGSGKSTLVQVLIGSLAPSSGQVIYMEEQEVSLLAFKHLSLVAPYLELIEEFRISEMIDFHFKFKKIKPELSKQYIIDLLQMNKCKHQLISHCSSGMKQRIKLALAFCADTPLLVLDEPTTSLDAVGIYWYFSLMEQFAKNRLTIICSNQEHEYGCCQKKLNLLHYKVALTENIVL